MQLVPAPHYDLCKCYLHIINITTILVSPRFNILWTEGETGKITVHYPCMGTAAIKHYWESVRFNWMFIPGIQGAII